MTMGHSMPSSSASATSHKALDPRPAPLKKVDPTLQDHQQQVRTTWAEVTRIENKLQKVERRGTWLEQEMRKVNLEHDTLHKDLEAAR